MLTKNQLRKKYLLIRQKRYFEIEPNFFNPLIALLRRKYKKRIIKISNYYPSLYEVNALKIFKKKNDDKFKILLPVLIGDKKMHFYRWNKNDLLKINRFGMLEPVSNT